MTRDCGCTLNEEESCDCLHCERCDEWVISEDHGGQFDSSGVCAQCTCDDCGKRIDNDYLDGWCESCWDKISAEKDRRTAEGWCYDCDEEKAVGVFWNEAWKTNMPLCLACLGEMKQADRAMDEYIARHGREPNLAEYARFGLELEDEDFQKSLPEDLE